MKQVILGLMILAVLSGCATPVAYKPYHVGFLTTGGYTDTKLQEGIYRVSFNGDGFTTSARAADLALLRCAEVAVRDGYKYFVVLSDKSETVSDVTYSGYRWVAPYDYPVTAYTIQCYKETPAGASGIVYDAGEVIKNVRAEYRIP